MESLMSPGSKHQMNSQGFPDRLENMIKVAIDKKLAGNTGVASHLYDVFAPLSSGTSNNFANGLTPFGFVGLRFNQTNRNQHIAALLERYRSRSDLSIAINNLAPSLGNSGFVPDLSLDQQLGQISQQLLGSLQVLIQEKLNVMNPAFNVPMMKKKRKKKGLGGKLKKMKKGFKKIGKMAKGITKMGKSLFKGVLKGVGGFFKSGPLMGMTGIFQLGGGLFGGLAGGPIGSKMLGQIAGKKCGAKFFQIFGQMSKMFGVIGNIHNGMNQFNLQNLSKMIRI